MSINKQTWKRVSIECPEYRLKYNDTYYVAKLSGNGKWYLYQISIEKYESNYSDIDWYYNSIVDALTLRDCKIWANIFINQKK